MQNAGASGLYSGYSGLIINKDYHVLNRTLWGGVWQIYVPMKENYWETAVRQQPYNYLSDFYVNV